MPKKKKGKAKKSKKVKMVGNETPEMIVKRFHKSYDKNCLLTNTACSASLHRLIKDCMENNNLMAKVIWISHTLTQAPWYPPTFWQSIQALCCLNRSSGIYHNLWGVLNHKLLAI